MLISFKRGTAAVVAATISLSLTVTAHAAETDRFQDVPKNAWHYTAVNFAANKGLFNGTSGTQFSPNASMTRGMFVTVLGRYAKIDVSQYRGTQFNDVLESAYYAPYAKWASLNHIVQGTGNDKFSPDDTITRQQLATMMYNFASSTGKETAVSTADAVVYYAFPDQNAVASYAVEPLKWATYNRVINGSDGKLKPAATATRAEVTQIMMNFDEYIEGKIIPNTTPDVKPDSKPNVPPGAITEWNSTMYEMAEELVMTDYTMDKVKEVGEKYAPMVCGKADATIEDLIAAMKAMTGAPLEAASMGTERANIYWTNVLATAIGQGEEQNSDDKPTVTDAQLRSYEDEMVRLVNEERKKADVPELERDEKLMQAARIWAKHLTIEFRHSAADEAFAILQEVGFKTTLNNTGGENIAGAAPPEESPPIAHMNAFMKSEGHRNTLLRDDYHKIGIGYAVNQYGHVYCAQWFY